MHFDASLPLDDLREVARIAAAAEEVGFSALWTSEIKHDPFLPLGIAAGATSHLGLGTSIAVAFPRSPTVVAQTAWDLAQLSEGRFMLGLGTQVKAHIERRFSSTWDHPVGRLRDYIGALRALWNCWQTGERLRYEGDFYTLKLMTPFFNPGPIAHPHIPLFIAGVNHQLCVLAGETCDGFHVHPFHTARYLREAILTWIEEGLSTAGRTRADIQVAASVFVIIGTTEEERSQSREDVRKQVSFYAATPTYRTLLEFHGRGSVGEELSALASRGRWDDMPALVTDEMLAQFAVEGDTLEDAAAQMRERYDGLLDRVAFYLPYMPGERDEEWRAAARKVQG